MVQGMRFYGGNAQLVISECFDNGNVEITCQAGTLSATMSADENDLREMRKWLTIQIRKMQKIRTKPSEKKNKL